MKRLIINADDLGLTAGANRAIFELSDAGAITSATLMAVASNTEAAVAASRERKGLGIGCHIVLVDGVPVLPPSEIPSLMDEREPRRFRPALGGFVGDLLRGRIREAEVEAEAAAQIRLLQRAGVALTHIDTHKHTHMFPRVLRPLLRAALMTGVRAIRNPFEPSWSVAATPGPRFVRRAQVTLLRSQRAYFLKAIRESGLLTTDGAIGVLATGTLDSTTLRSLLTAIPDGKWELVCHPGYRDAQLDAAHTRLLGSREVERDALREVIPDAIADDSTLSLINFGQLTDERLRSRS